MKKFWQQDRGAIFFIVMLFVGWRASLFIPLILGQNLKERAGFIASIPWANFDGMHYLSIAQSGYVTYQHAFFPGFPLLIRFLAPQFDYDYISSAQFIVHVSLLITLFLLYKLVRLDYDKKIAKWALVFLLSFPTAFFLASVYNESVFLVLVLGSFYAARKGKWLLAGLLGMFASATRFVGIFLLPVLIVEFFIQAKLVNTSIQRSIRAIARRAWGIFLVPIGLFSYMFYLNIYPPNDFLAFIHSQPAFGAGRSGGEIILLPQVFFRYFKIFITVPFSNYDYWIALLEVLVFLLVVLTLFLSYRSRMRKSYLLFSAFAIVVPTLSGTLSSIPRYALSSISTFIFFATIENKMVRNLILGVGLMLELILSMLFLRGYFVS